MKVKKKNKKGQGRKPDPSRGINFRFKLADYATLEQMYGNQKGDVSGGLKALALIAIQDYKINNS